MDFSAADAIYPEWIELVERYNTLNLAPYTEKRSHTFVRVISERFHWRASPIPHEILEPHEKLVNFETTHKNLIPLLVFLYEKRHRKFSEEEFYAIWRLIFLTAHHGETRTWWTMESQVHSEQIGAINSLCNALTNGKISGTTYETLYEQYDENHRREFSWKGQATRIESLLLFEELFLDRVIDICKPKNLRIHGLTYRSYDLACGKCLGYPGY